MFSSVAVRSIPTSFSVLSYFLVLRDHVFEHADVANRIPHKPVIRNMSNAADVYINTNEQT